MVQLGIASLELASVRMSHIPLEGSYISQSIRSTFFSSGQQSGQWTDNYSSFSVLKIFVFYFFGFVMFLLASFATSVASDFNCSSSVL